jgi:pyruvate,water dikinase
VRDVAALLAAVRSCWASLWTARALAYRRRQGIAPESVSLAVVVQRMVPSDAAGILFTANPVGGQRDQTVINASWGLGEAIVGGLVTPDTVVLDTASGRIVSRETADKQVMTVAGETGTQGQPVPETRRRQPVLDDGEAADLARFGAQIEQLYGVPQDVEWARSQGEFFIMQARPITALPDAQVEAPTDWTVPDPESLYTRSSIVELLPDPLSPLFATMSATAVTQTIREVTGAGFGEGVLPDDFIELTTINGYAYYRFRVTLENLWPLVRALPMAASSLSQMMGPQRWREITRPTYSRTVEDWEARSLRDLSATELLTGVEELLYQGAEYYTSVQQIIPVAVTSETLFTRFYDRLVKRPGDPAAAVFLLGFDSTPIRAERSLYDLAMWCRAHPALAAVLADAASDRVLDLLHADSPDAEVDEAVWRTWQARFREHLDRYGRMVYDLDFAKPVPADDPRPTFDALKLFLRGEGRDPYERQTEAAATRERATATVLARLDPLRRVILRRLLVWAQRNAPLREDALADVGLGWPVIRRMLLELGRRLVAAQVIADADDVFWLEHDELRTAAFASDMGRADVEDLGDVVRQRKATWHGQKLAMPPLLLPRGKRFFGVDLEPWMPGRMDEQTGAVIAGVGASPGRITAPARILRGPEDFGQMRPGEVLVASITTPAWTPLFAMASAVVTDVGGPLSHGSIVAREYGIPAVMGTGVATRRIRSGQNIRVDGDAGTVVLLDEVGAVVDEQPLQESTSSRRRTPSARTLVLAGLAGGALVGGAMWLRSRRRQEL